MYITDRTAPARAGRNRLVWSRPDKPRPHKRRRSGRALWRRPWRCVSFIVWCTSKYRLASSTGSSTGTPSARSGPMSAPPEALLLPPSTGTGSGCIAARIFSMAPSDSGRDLRFEANDRADAGVGFHRQHMLRLFIADQSRIFLRARQAEFLVREQHHANRARGLAIQT